MAQGFEYRPMIALLLREGEDSRCVDLDQCSRPEDNQIRKTVFQDVLKEVREKQALFSASSLYRGPGRHQRQRQFRRRLQQWRN